MLLSLLRNSNASAAAELALVTPMLVVLMFGSFEMGNYFLSEHVVIKAVRDGARYAARLNFTNYSCTSAGTGKTPGGTVVNDTRNVVRTGQVTTGGNPRLVGWTDVTTITVTYDCVDPASASPSYTGIYNGMPNVPVVKVSAAVPYASLFKNLGFTSASLTLNAESQSAVMGL